MKIVSRGVTKNYNKFSMVVGNREYREAKAKKIAEAIKKHNMLSLFPVICVKDGDKLKIMDGQHRVHAAEMIGYEVHYIIVDNLSINDVRILNTNQSEWKTSDYMHHFCSVGIPDYQLLDSFCKRFKIGLMISAALLSGESTTSGTVTNAFRNGKFKYSNEKNAHIVAAIVSALVSCGLRFATGRACVLALSRIAATGRISMEVFNRRYDRIAGMLKPCASWQQFSEMFSDAYDYKRPVDQRAELHAHVVKAEREKMSAYNKTYNHK